MAGLKPAFDKEGSVTAGTSSPLTDGASAVLVTSEDYARAHGLEILARIKSVGVAGCAPDVMGLGPIGASKKALDRAGVTVGQLNVVELNEAFASQALACAQELGLNAETINLDGGAIAHRPSARRHRCARIVGKAASLAQARGRPVRAGHPVHRRRPGHRHRARGGLSHD